MKDFDFNCSYFRAFTSEETNCILLTLTSPSPHNSYFINFQTKLIFT